jgi:hypothetical protein
MSGRTAPLVIAVSGPDGAGKSSLVADLIPALRRRGLATATAYCYGCVVCRRFGALAGTGMGTPGRGGCARIRTFLDRSHALADAAELTGRLAGARFRARAAARRGRAAVVTDRGPLDGLAKFDPAPGSWPAAFFTRLSRNYDLTLLLDASPDILATRDGEHTAAQLNDLRDRYLCWQRRLPRVAFLGAEARPEEVAAEALQLVLSGDLPYPPRPEDLRYSPRPDDPRGWQGERHAG